MAKKPMVAMQMYTFRKEAAADYPGTLKRLAQMGWPAVQVSGIHSYKAKDIGKVMKDLGLGSAGTHVNFRKLETEFNAFVDLVKDLGTEWAIIPSRPDDWAPGADGWRSFGRAMTEMGAKLKKVGLRLGYHNHAFEFQKLDGKPGYDLFFESADPGLVHNELDTYWVQYAGCDPVAYLKKFAGHIQVTHFKDMGPGQEKPMVPIGTGILDWPKIIEACKAGGTEWICCEQDETAPLETWEAARQSLESCKKWGLV